MAKKMTETQTQREINRLNKQLTHIENQILVAKKKAELKKKKAQVSTIARGK